SVLVLAAIGLCHAVVTRSKDALLLVLWLGAAVGSVMFITRAVGPVRYGLYMMPPLIGPPALPTPPRLLPPPPPTYCPLRVSASPSDAHVIAALDIPLSRAPGY